MKITSNLLSEKLHIPITKVRRWAKEFLPPDPIATRRSGYTRKMSLNAAFNVYLGGILVSLLGFSFYEGRDILEKLSPWMKKVGLLPEIPSGVKKRSR